MQTHKKDNNTSDMIIIYFQTHKVEHFYHEIHRCFLTKTVMTCTHLGANVFQTILKSRVNILSSILTRKHGHLSSFINRGRTDGVEADLYSERSEHSLLLALILLCVR